MLLIPIGSREVRSSSISTKMPCPCCEEENALEAVAYQSYGHVFWIPFAPIERAFTFECKFCREEFFIDTIDTPIDTQIVEAVKKSKAPLWTYTGCIVSILALLYFMFALLSE